jgi:hypothetical protein
MVPWYHTSTDGGDPAAARSITVGSPGLTTWYTSMDSSTYTMYRTMWHESTRYPFTIEKIFLNADIILALCCRAARLFGVVRDKRL